MNRLTTVNSSPDTLKIPHISIDTNTYQVFVGKKRVNNLTITEFNLLACFLKNAGKALSRDDLLSAVWDESYQGTERTVDTHIGRLRLKLGMAAYLIRTVRGVGYRLEK